MTPESHSPTGTHDPFAPPPGCPAHGLGLGPGGLHRLHEAEDLSELYEQLREQHGQVAPVLLHEDVPMWVVLGHTENLHMVRTPSQFCRDSRIWTPLLEGMVKPDHPLMPHIAWQPICSHAEGDEHLRLRGAVTGAMSTIDHRGMRRHINRSTQRLVNRFCEQGRADLVAQFAEHLPMAVMCEILGMPDEYNDRIVEAARDMLKGTETAIASNAYIMDALMRLTAKRRARPEDDFASHLINHPARLTDDEIGQHLRVVLIAAYEATANLLANVLRVVLTDPRFRAQLSGGQMTVPQAVEQSLWDEPPFSTVFAYFAKQDTELGGQRIRKGDGLLLRPGAGQRRPAGTPRPRPRNMMGNRSHLAFGGGPHECPGAGHRAGHRRRRRRRAADAAAGRRSSTATRTSCAWRSSIASRHLVELPVRFEPKPQQDVNAAAEPRARPRTGAPRLAGAACPQVDERTSRRSPRHPAEPAPANAAPPHAGTGPAERAWRRFAGAGGGGC